MQAPVTAYLYFQNLLNRRNEVNVYWRTGNTEDDGYREIFTPEFRDRAPDTFELYQLINLQNRQHYALVQGGDLFGRPREIRFGLQVGFGGKRR